MPDDQPKPVDQSLPVATAQRFDLIFSLLQEVTSLTVLGEFLKSKELPHSASSWVEMKDKRLLPYLKSNQISLEELSHVLSESEEYGRNHTFLYQASEAHAAAAMARPHLESVCQKLGCSEALLGVEVQNMPTAPTLTQIRDETTKGHRTLTFKIVQSRIEKEFIGETFKENVLTRQWTYKSVRAVNVACLHASGLLEIRIHSHISSTKYEADVTAVRQMLREFLPLTQFMPVPLGNAKKSVVGAEEGTREPDPFLRFHAHQRSRQQNDRLHWACGRRSVHRRFDVREHCRVFTCSGDALRIVKYLVEAG